eukprot:CAMPEP_0198127552 /NCGR_PEP_ID=MMETSP1442-20131203/47490_1 /TAXON_ID= /ORGANISM="Craspedostauros australis, Strain CCMP3328" /LENGTH=60 /DNA_ID=CAMNT_0043787543 /DNA_START=265 /DNA_END=444 /DNA_ORIENTATION=-
MPQQQLEYQQIPERLMLHALRSLTEQLEETIGEMEEEWSIEYWHEDKTAQFMLLIHACSS